MQDNLLSIGKMAEMNHLTVAALRLYDEMNLLKPRLIDPTSGYRYYDISQNARLDMIAYMKELGMSLAEIQDVLEKEDIAQIETILVKKNEQLYEEMRLLRAKHHAVERAITSIERYRKSPTKGTISLEYIERDIPAVIRINGILYKAEIGYYYSVAGEAVYTLRITEF